MKTDTTAVLKISYSDCSVFLSFENHMVFDRNGVEFFRDVSLYVYNVFDWNKITTQDCHQLARNICYNN